MYNMTSVHVTHDKSTSNATCAMTLTAGLHRRSCTQYIRYTIGYSRAGCTSPSSPPFAQLSHAKCDFRPVRSGFSHRSVTRQTLAPEGWLDSYQATFQTGRPLAGRLLTPLPKIMSSFTSPEGEPLTPAGT